MENLVGYVLQCKQCSEVFVICKSCYRGHKYCSKSCRDEGYKENQSKAKKKYETSEEAKLDHRDRSRRYRLKLKENVTHETSNFLSFKIKTPLQHKDFHEAVNKVRDCSGICISCGAVVFKEGVNIYGGPI